jgi:hypothetical protein
MRQWLRASALCYSAGTVGGLAKGGLIWACGRAVLTAPLADDLARALHPGGIYMRLVWSGMYALIFLLPFARSSLLLRGLLGAMAVSVFQLLLLPLIQHSNLHIFTFTTLALLVLNCAWGIAAAAMLRITE